MYNDLFQCLLAELCANLRPHTQTCLSHCRWCVLDRSPCSNTFWCSSCSGLAHISHTGPSLTTATEYINVWLQSQTAGPHWNILIGMDEMEELETFHRTLLSAALMLDVYRAVLAITLNTLEHNKVIKSVRHRFNRLSGNCVWFLWLVQIYSQFLWSGHS